MPVGSDTQFIVFDSAKAGAAALNPASATDGPIFTRYQAQMQQVAALAADPNVFSIFTNHHPLLAYTSVAGANPIGGNAPLLSVMSATYPGRVLPAQHQAGARGHNHIFEAIDFATPHPVEILPATAATTWTSTCPIRSRSVRRRAAASSRRPAWSPTRSPT